MTPSSLQKLRTAVALLRTHGENDAADGLLDVMEGEVAGRSVPCRHPVLFNSPLHGAELGPGDVTFCGQCGATVGAGQPPRTVTTPTGGLHFMLPCAAVVVPDVSLGSSDDPLVLLAASVDLT